MMVNKHKQVFSARITIKSTKIIINLDLMDL